jgi:hypothetical protein
MTESRTISNSNITNKSKNIIKVYSGKIGAFGYHTSGKTRTIFGLLNHTTKKNTYIWDEEKEYSGTHSTNPYTVEWGITDKKALIIDNPGQNHYKSVRNYVARSGDPYNALIIVLDAIAWNFSDVPFLQVKSVLEQTETFSLLTIIVITKSALLSALIRYEQIDVIARKLVKTLQIATEGDRIPFYNRSEKKIGWLLFKSENGRVKFSILEQLFTNAIEDLLLKNPISGLTKSNIRTLVRSLLFGYCKLIESWLSLPEYRKMYQEINIPNNLIDILSNYRGTILESGIEWTNHTKNPDINEFFLPMDVFDYTQILDVFKRYCLAPSEDEQLKNEVLELCSSNIPLCEPIGPISVDNYNRKHLDDLDESVKKIVNEMDIPKKSKKEETKFSQYKEPPPKPKPKKSS